MLHLRAPLRIYCLCQAENTQIEREVGYINKFTVSAECWAGREKQSLRRAGASEAFEIAQPGKQFAGWADDVDFVVLIGGHPEVVMCVNGNSVRAIDAVDEQDWFRACHGSQESAQSCHCRCWRQTKLSPRD